MGHLGEQGPALPALTCPTTQRTHKSICKLRAEWRSLSTRTDSPGRAHQCFKEDKQLSSPLGWRLGPQLKLPGLVYLLPSMISLLFECFISAQVCEGRRGGGEQGTVRPFFLAVPSLSFAVTATLHLLSPASLSSMPSLLPIKARFNVFPSLPG